MQSQRNYGVDLLRIISTFMVLLLHILGQGGLLAVLSSGSIRYKTAWFLESACYCAVNCYGLISGYVGVKSRFTYSNILRTWLQVAFYTVGAAVVLYFFLPGIVTPETIIQAFFPVITNKYWYYTAYFCMSFFIPAMNHIIRTFPKKQLRFLILSGAVLFSVLPTLTGNDLFNLSNGYTVLWLIYLYMLGGYLSQYPLGRNFTALRCFLIALAAVVITELHRTLSSRLGLLESIHLLRYISPTVLLCAVGLLTGFSQCTFPRWLQSVTGFLAPLCFGVYLLHAQGIVYSNFLKNRFGHLGEYHTVIMLLTIVLTALFWFMLGIAIDWIRQKLFRLLPVRSLCRRLDGLLEKIL